MRSQRWGPHDGVNGLISRDTESLLSLSPSPLVSATQGSSNHLQARKRALIGEQNQPSLDPGLPSFQNCTKQITVYLCSSQANLYYFVIATQTD